MPLAVHLQMSAREQLHCGYEKRSVLATLLLTGAKLGPRTASEHVSTRVYDSLKVLRGPSSKKAGIRVGVHSLETATTRLRSVPLRELGINNNKKSTSEGQQQRGLRRARGEAESAKLRGCEGGVRRQRHTACQAPHPEVHQPPLCYSQRVT